MYNNPEICKQEIINRNLPEHTRPYMYTKLFESINNIICVQYVQQFGNVYTRQTMKYTYIHT